jgi:competence protein ComEC
VSVAGFVTAVPRRQDGEVRVRVDTPDGRLLVVAPEPVPDLPVGSGVEAVGSAGPPADWERAYLTRLGIRTVLSARAIELTGAHRDGLAGALDGVRLRAEAALRRGTAEPAADLLRGFVLGQDDRIDPETVEDFKRSGLAHLLAVSGQNVLLLAVLAAAILGALGVPLRSRLVWILLAIALYVPVAGASPSIQRAGIAGAAGVVAALASRPHARWQALLLAAAGTLALNPRATGDVGWQLSFAAVVGILLFAGRLRSVLGGSAGGARGALAEGAALTLAATLATAPLMAHHFGTASLVALPANAAALPAVAPVMWLGMLAGAAGQFAWVPVEPFTWLAGGLAGYVAQVAAWFAAPSWALVEAPLPGGLPFAAVLLALVGAAALALRSAGRRVGLRPPNARAGSVRRWLPAALAACAVALLLAPLGRGPGEPGIPRGGLRLRFLDVGQGDAILLEPAGEDPVLVDTGTAGAGVVDDLAAAGVGRLEAVVITHPESDHSGAVTEVLAGFDVGRVVFARLERRAIGAARAAGVPLSRVVAGDRMRIGPLRLEVLWPPGGRLAAARRAGGALSGDPNETSLVLRASSGRFEALLTGDAEAEIAPVHPGRLELLKVAHHGSEDAGLERLLAEARPAVAVLSVGSENPYGHPAGPTLAALAAAGTRVLRTDEDGEVVVDVGEGGWHVR